MSLRAVAESDLALTLEYGTDWGQAIIVTDPAELQVTLNGQSGDIGALIDPDTGMGVSGRLAHVSLRISSVLTAFGALPVGIAESAQNPWRVSFPGSATPAQEYKVSETRPDKTLGVITLIVEVYEDVV